MTIDFRSTIYPLRQYSGAGVLEKLPFFSKLGMPIRLCDLGIPRDGLEDAMPCALKNFNADPKREFVREREFLGKVLLSAW